MKKFLAILPLLLLAATLRAQSPAGLTQEDLSKILSPCIDNQTLAVAHLDTARIDLPAAQKFVDEILAQVTTTDDETKKIPASITAGRMLVDAYLGKFQSFGGRHAFLVLSHADLWPFIEPPVAILMPVENNADPKPLIEFLKSIPTSQDLPMTAELLRDNIVFYGTANSLAHLKNLTPQPRPDILAPLVSAPGASGAALQILYVQTPDIRRTIAEIAPRFPTDSPVLAGQSTDFLSRGLNYVSLSVALPPNPSITLTFSTDSPADAGKLATTAKAFLDLAVADPGYQREIASPRAEEKVALAASQLFLSYLYEPLNAPNSTSDLTITLDNAKLHSFFQFVAPVLANARASALRQKTMTDIRSILMAGSMYAVDNKNAWPDDFQTLITKEYLQKTAVLTSSADPQHRPFVYHPWTSEQLKILDSATTPVIWETSDDDRTRISIGFLDGHVESDTRPHLAEMLKKAEQQLQAK